LLHSIEQDGFAAKVVIGAIRAGLPIPDKILNAPELLPGLDYYLDLFFKLDTERYFSDGPIPFSAVRAVETREDLEETWEIINGLDAAILAHFREKRKKNASKPTTKGRQSVKS
jgi:hypothetical protein